MSPGLHERAWHWIAALDPDLAFLQETEPPGWAAERWELVVGPHQFFASALADAARASQLQPGDAARGRRARRVRLLPRDGRDRRVRRATPLFVSSVHTSARVAPEWGHPGLDRAAIARGRASASRGGTTSPSRDTASSSPIAGSSLAGDWNTSRWVDADGVAEPAGAEFFARAAAAGWVGALARRRRPRGQDLVRLDEPADVPARPRLRRSRDRRHPSVVRDRAVAGERARPVGPRAPRPRARPRGRRHPKSRRARHGGRRCLMSRCPDIGHLLIEDVEREIDRSATGRARLWFSEPRPGYALRQGQQRQGAGSPRGSGLRE